MNELCKKVFEWLERYWHKKAVAFIAPLGVSAIVFLFFYSSHSETISKFNLALVFIAGSVVLTIWILTNHLPRVKKGNAGIVIGILCDGPDEEKQVKIDFIANLRLLMQQGGSRFQLVELPSWALDGLENFSAMNNLLTKVRGHFLLYGRVRLRNKDGKPAHLLSFEGIVRHRPTTEEIQKSLVRDFSRVLPRRVAIEKENDAFSFEATSEWTDVSTRYIVGTAALISGDVAYAENLFLYVENKLKQTHNLNAGVKEISRLLPHRFRQLYQAWLVHLYDAYFSTRDTRYLEKCDQICAKLFAYDPANYSAMMVKAICEFMLRRDVSAAHKLITKCRNDKDATWWYSRAFLHAYQGKLDEAVSDYRHAFDGPILEKSVPIQCEEFIQSVLAQEPACVQLHYCSGLINFHAKHDFAAAERDFNLFLKSPKNDLFLRQVKSASELISECKTSSVGQTA